MANSQKESIHGPDFSESISLQEFLDLSIISSPISTKKSLEVPLPSISVFSKDTTEVPPSTDFRSPAELAENESVLSAIRSSPVESKQAYTPDSLISLNKAVQFPSFSSSSVSSVTNSWRESIKGLDFSESNLLQESLEYSVISQPRSTRDSLEVSLLSPSTFLTGEDLPSPALWSPVELAGKENGQSITPSSPKESEKSLLPSALLSPNTCLQFPSFSPPRVLLVTSSHRESVQGLDFSEPNSLQGSFGFSDTSGQRSTTEFLEDPLLSTSISSKGAAESHLPSGLKSPIELAGDKSAQSVIPSSSRESKKASLPASLISLSKGIQFLSFSGSNLLSVASSRRQSIQGQDFSVPNSLQESLDFFIISGPSSTRESLEVPLLSTLTSSKGTKERQQSPGLQSPVEFAKDDGTWSTSPSSPKGSARPSPAASPRSLSKTFTYPYCSGPSISQHFMEVPDFSVPTSHKESTQAPALSSPNSIREFFEFPTISKSSSARESFEVPSFYTSSSSGISIHVSTSSGLKSPTEYAEGERTHSPRSGSTGHCSDSFCWLAVALMGTSMGMLFGYSLSHLSSKLS
ncbi:uncharacterized protein LOC144455473 [Phascolarctos cinereus]